MTEKMQASVPLGLCAVMPLFGEVDLFPAKRSNIVRLRNRRFAQKLASPDTFTIRCDHRNKSDLKFGNIDFRVSELVVIDVHAV